MYTHNASISVRQTRLLLILQMFNMSMLVIPRVAAKQAGHDGYLLPILGFCIGLIYIFLITKLLDRFPGESMDIFSRKILGKWLGWSVIGVYVIKLLIGAGFEVRLFAEMISQVLLPQTPLPVIVLILLFTVYYLIKSGLEASGRMAEILAYFILIPLAFVLCLILIKPDYGQLLPILQVNPKGLFIGGYCMSMTFMPLEFMLIIGALVNKPSKVKKICIYAIGFISIIEVFIIALTFMGVGMVSSTKQIWPVLTLMQSIQLPGSFLENQEILMMSWWVLSVYMYISGSLYIAGVTISKVMKFNRQNVTVLPMIPIVFIIAMIPGSLGESYSYLTSFTTYTGPLFLFFVPLMLLIVAKFRKVGGQNE